MSSSALVHLRGGIKVRASAFRPIFVISERSVSGSEPTTAAPTALRPHGPGEVIRSIEHGHDTLRGYACHDVMHLLEYEASTVPQSPDLLHHVLLDAFGCPLRQDGLRIAATSPEDDVPAELPLQPLDFHAHG